MKRVVGVPEKSRPTSLEITANPAAFAAASTCPANTACAPMLIYPIPLRFSVTVLFYRPNPILRHAGIRAQSPGRKNGFDQCLLPHSDCECDQGTQKNCA